jgi:metallophosphoesterase (TIGR00282 family)
MKNGKLRVLFIGDIVGRPGRNTVKHFLPLIKQEDDIDFVVANGENLSGGKGMTFENYEEMINSGVDYFTSGNHIWNNSDIMQHLKDNTVKVLRPANYSGKTPGEGFTTFEVKGTKFTLINVLGRVFIPILLDDPFSCARDIVDTHKDSICLVDFHAEATSEKIAMAHYLDGRAAVVVGTHTHVQTADETILPNGTGFITDLGMCGPEDSVLGVKKEIIIAGFLTGTPQSHKVASGDCIFNACLFEIDTKSKKTVKVERYYKKLKA